MILDSPTTTVTSGCCIRLGTDGLYLHHNTAHAAVGVRRTFINSDGKVEILHHAPGPVVTMWVNPDETLAARGVTLGPSGGVDRTVITLAHGGRALDLTRADHYGIVAGRWSNMWVGWVHAAKAGI
ncbi:hypothetical protein [Janibacter anophelis]|uniref:hypothetical protein n=1 Tax=Janibacter anophelis TaxID=319054 RepID=UPI000DEEEF54|nr:hypothetical protein [Janibacter anophelis]